MTDAPNQVLQAQAFEPAAAPQLEGSSAPGEVIYFDATLKEWVVNVYVKERNRFKRKAFSMDRFGEHGALSVAKSWMEDLKTNNLPKGLFFDAVQGRWRVSCRKGGKPTFQYFPLMKHGGYTEARDVAKSFLDEGKGRSYVDVDNVPEHNLNRLGLSKCSARSSSRQMGTGMPQSNKAVRKEDDFVNKISSNSPTTRRSPVESFRNPIGASHKEAYPSRKEAYPEISQPSRFDQKKQFQTFMESHTACDTHKNRFVIRQDKKEQKDVNEEGTANSNVGRKRYCKFDAEIDSVVEETQCKRRQFDACCRLILDEFKEMKNIRDSLSRELTQKIFDISPKSWGSAGVCKKRDLVFRKGAIFVLYSRESAPNVERFWLVRIHETKTYDSLLKGDGFGITCVFLTKIGAYKYKLNYEFSAIRVPIRWFLLDDLGEFVKPKYVSLDDASILVPRDEYDRISGLAENHLQNLGISDQEDHEHR
eukprot:CAMPEP_0184491334 /NCGR_PEP_ID=MMETSP0113_2-20130426/20163_1 /TAXON_ID=91329 /ORGANISM="Norrisiella sphaerica, Strain BC52" /LENGTH=476 /DNA_ID=CAMNT_0026875655 /DNA_START=61 /DNA_END=1491 /DNA_ORIENTATION=-